ncbi:hypothetical protein EVAR_45928_1 [Eumeta japonica]|uniref:Uncharacterized protein n=1 Tax=Eumeta variegata TaxID=151549 RepID=A0A4C1W5A9_EUMVA|nr:hypothetical protein EVAR_45928_1 [Eumeta japonica]
MRCPIDPRPKPLENELLHPIHRPISVPIIIPTAIPFSFLTPTQLPAPIPLTIDSDRCPAFVLGPGLNLSKLLFWSRLNSDLGTAAYFNSHRALDSNFRPALDRTLVRSRFRSLPVSTFDSVTWHGLELDGANIKIKI